MSWLIITEPWENEMRVVVLARKNVAAMKTGARHLLRSVGVLSPSTGTQFFPSAFANDCWSNFVMTFFRRVESRHHFRCCVAGIGTLEFLIKVRWTFIFLGFFSAPDALIKHWTFNYFSKLSILDV